MPAPDDTRWPALPVLFLLRGPVRGDHRGPIDENGLVVRGPTVGPGRGPNIRSCRSRISAMCCLIIHHARTRLVAPFDGVVVKGDLTQSLGSPVAKGDVLFEVAPLDGYRVILSIDERDISDVREGGRGRLAKSRDTPLAIWRTAIIGAVAF